MEFIPSAPGGLNPPSTFHTPNLLFDQSQALYYPMDQARTANSDHPNFGRLVGLVCEAVLEVVCVSGLGYIAARRGLFTANVQKNVANLNIFFFTPCLIFSKLSSQLTADKLTELWIIPLILAVQTIVSWLAAEGGTRLLKINKVPQRNFVKAMAVFGNSNSLPLSLIISLSHTISGLHWDQVHNDNDDEVGARGILYLLIFSQLGQAVRWSWGMNTLLRPMSDYTPAERGELPRDEEEPDLYKDSDSDDSRPGSSEGSASSSRTSSIASVNQIKTDEIATASGREEAPEINAGVSVRTTLAVPDGDHPPERPKSPMGQAAQSAIDYSQQARAEFSGWRAKTWTQIKSLLQRAYNSVTTNISAAGHAVFSALPNVIQKILSRTWYGFAFVVSRIWSCLNVPLMAIIAAVIVGSVPALKAFFYTPGTFVNNTVTSAIKQLAGVAVPLILFVLGGNLCKSTLPDENIDDPVYRREKRNMLWCSLLSRMLIPLLVMAPFLGVLAKYTPISILDDPIFIIVCFLLTGAPSALQLAQICQVNDVFVPVISDLLMQSYVVWIFPSTIVLVVLALAVVKWAA